MKLVYHGTSVSNSINIARDRAILSNWYLLVKNIREGFGRKLDGSFQNEQKFIERHGKNVEEFIFSVLTNKKTENEQRRQTTVSLTSILEVAKNYTSRDKENGGVILSCEVTPELEESFPKDWEKRGVFYVPKKFEISYFKQVYMNAIALKKHKDKVKNAFSKYSPQFLEV